MIYNDKIKINNSKIDSFEARINKISVKTEEEKTVNVTQNGTTIVTPTVDKVLNKVTINTNCPVSKVETVEVLIEDYYSRLGVMFTDENVVLQTDEIIEESRTIRVLKNTIIGFPNLFIRDNFSVSGELKMITEGDSVRGIQVLGGGKIVHTSYSSGGMN